MRTTAAGSLPGGDFPGALRTMLELFPLAAPLPELPARGPASSMIGRAVAHLEGIAAEFSSGGWRVTDHVGRDHRRAAAQWRQDLDDLEEVAQGFTGVIKIGICGPLTLAACLARPRAEVVLADPAAVHDIAQSLHAGVSDLLAEVRRRLPDASVLLQVDEPMLEMILSGQLRSASGLRRLRAVDADEAIDLLRPFGQEAWLHCCGGGDWLPVAAKAGFAGAYVDVRLVDFDLLGEWSESGRELVAGIARTDTHQTPSLDELIEAGKPMRDLGDVWLAPACGLGLWPQRDAAELLRRVARAGEVLDRDG